MLRNVLALGLACGLALFAPARPAEAQRLSLISDAEIEHTIAVFARPILQAAHLSPDSVDIVLVNDSRLNAFVAGGQRLYVNTGLLMQTENAGQIIGVIAHEVGHIAGGHLVRGAEALERARNQALISTLIALAAGAAAGNAGAGVAVLSGGQSFAQAGMIVFTRGMESSADQAALTYLDRAGYSAEGLMSFLDRLADAELGTVSRDTMYLQTHPLFIERLETVAQHVRTSPLTGTPLPAGYDELFRRMQAKLFGFLDPQTAMRRYPASDTSTAGRYARAIANFQRGDLSVALSLIQQLAAEEPNNPYFQELEGQILLETGRVAEAQPAYERALALLPGEPQFLVPLAQARLEGGNPADLPRVIDDLNRAITIGGRGQAFAWRLLATAYGRQGDLGMSSVALAEEALAYGDRETAREQATRAQQVLAQGSRGWLRAQDILRAAEDL